MTDFSARAVALPDAWEQGVGANSPMLVCGEHAHYAITRPAGELGIGEQTRILPPSDHGDVPAILSRLDVLVLPSRTTPKWKEQFGRVLIEGMAAGVPLVGSTVGGIPYMVRDGENGFLFPTGDSHALEAQLRHMAASEGRRASAAR